MGVATSINFQPTGGGKAAITGDFVMLGSEVNPVIRALRDNGIAVDRAAQPHDRRDAAPLLHALLGERRRAEVGARPERRAGEDELGQAQGVDGKAFVQERIALAQKQPTFWQEYKFKNPVTKKVEQKQTYCERYEDTAVCAGVYKFYRGF